MDSKDENRERERQMEVNKIVESEEICINENKGSGERKREGKIHGKGGDGYRC